MIEVMAQWCSAVSGTLGGAGMGLNLGTGGGNELDGPPSKEGTNQKGTGKHFYIEYN